jgi:hypothetical protein
VAQLILLQTDQILNYGLDQKMDAKSVIYITYRDSKLHKDIISKPIPSDVSMINVIKMVQELPAHAIGPRIIMDRKDVSFGKKEHVNIHFRNKKSSTDQ